MSSRIGELANSPILQIANSPTRQLTNCVVSKRFEERAMSSKPEGPNPVSRRRFLKTTVAKGAAGVVVAAGLPSREAEAASIKWDRSADVVVVGAGVSGLACACAATDVGASVIMIEE